MGGGQRPVFHDYYHLLPEGSECRDKTQYVKVITYYTVVMVILYEVRCR